MILASPFYARYNPTRPSADYYPVRLQIQAPSKCIDMPSYTYRCENCDHQFDRHQAFSDNPLKRCPNCSKHALRRVYKPTGVVFKGSGFYATDNKSKSRSPAGSNGKSEKKDKTTESSKAGEKKKSKDSAKTKTKSEKSGE